MIRFIISCVTLLKNLVFLPFRLFGGILTYIKKMGCGDSKPVIVQHWEHVANNWIIDIKILRNLLTRYMMGNSHLSFQQTARNNILEIFSRIDNFVITSKKLAIRQFPTQCPNRKILEDQVNQVEQLSQSQLHNQYQIKQLEETIRKQENYIQVLLRKNQILENKVQEAENQVKSLNEFDISTNNNIELIKIDPGTSTNRSNEVPFEQRKSVSEEAANPYVMKSLAKIEDICNEVNKLKIEVDNFIGAKDDKNFLHIRELLLRQAVKLDDVETEGYLIIREKIREVIRLVQQTVEDLTRRVDM